MDNSEAPGNLVVPLVFKTNEGRLRVLGGFDSHSPPCRLRPKLPTAQYRAAAFVLEGWSHVEPIAIVAQRRYRSYGGGT